MLRYLQVKQNKAVPVLVANADLTAGAVIAKSASTGKVDVATGAGDYLVDCAKSYGGINAVVNPTDAESTAIASGARCQVVPTFVGERYATSEAVVTYADVGDPLNATAGKMGKAASETAYQWVFGGYKIDPAGKLAIIERVAGDNAPATRTMTYDANGGAGTMLDAYSPYYVGKKITVRECAFTAPTYKDFVEWDTVAGGTGTAYSPGDEIAVAASNIKLYAQYEDTHTKLVLNGNTGEGTMADTSKYYVDEIITVPESTFTPPPGKKFSKWNTTAGGDGTDYSPDDEIPVTEAMIGAATTLYAIWVDD